MNYMSQENSDYVYLQLESLVIDKEDAFPGE